ncbi:hypothetical protein A9R05_34245 (plasmid) [Burkholderia sp. KK1]|nr:hypothetical protein A9R05_34245 [Burkholderia sp. KK1]
MWQSTIRIPMLAGVVLLGAAAWALCASLTGPDEIALKLGESYEAVRQRSGSILPARNSDWGSLPKVIAKFRFDDPQYGFTTPRAVLSQMSFGGPDNSEVESVELSPQVTPLPLDDVIAVVTQLQDKLRRRGWRPFRYSRMRPIEDTPGLRRLLRDCQFPMSVWNAGDKAQVVIDIGCHSIPPQPDRERYVITLELTRPFWTDRLNE